MQRCAFPAIVLAIAAALVPLRQAEPLPDPAPWPVQAEPLPALSAELEADAFALAQVATGEDPRAAVAVTWVVLNRAGCQVAPLRCARPVLGEITRRRAFGTMKGGTWRPAWTPTRLAAVQVHRKVWAVLQGLPDPTGGATHFHRLGTWTPPWAPPRRSWRVYGSHAFYRPVPGRVVKSAFKPTKH